MIALREALQRQRRRLSILAVLCALCTVLIWAHSGGEGHMAADEGMTAQAISTCLAVLHGTAGILLSALAVSAFWRRRPPWTLTATVSFGSFPHPERLTSIRPRAGPPVLQVFLR